MNTLRRSALLLCLGWLCNAGIAEALMLTTDKQAEIPIRVPENADARMTAAASDLSTYLGKIFRKPFPLETGRNGQGILLGTVEDYPEFKPRLEQDIPGAKEGYVIKSDSKRVLLVGTSSLGVQNAVWEFLYRLGYRQYFPSDKWEIVPRLENVNIALDFVSYPSFATRNISIGANTWPELVKEFQTWKVRNRLDSGFDLSTSHEYGRIIKRNQEALHLHPEYLAGSCGGENDKFVIANPGLRKLVIEDARAQLRNNPARDSVSLEPSDGLGWPISSPLGSVSNQVVTLANEAVAALQDENPGLKVGIRAYGEHSPPPSINVHPDVVVSVATAFISGGYTFKDLMAGWAKRGATLGVRDYYGVWQWDKDLPGKSKASNPQKIAENLVEFYGLGARYFAAEASYSWGPNGLGHFVAARCLWDLAEAEKVDAIREDFLKKAFGSAKEPMRRFYNIIDGRSSPLLSDHLLGSMYRALKEAYAGTSDPAVVARIDDLAAYTRFVELFRDDQNSHGKDEQQALDVLSEYCKSIRSLGMVHTRGMFRDRAKRDSNFTFLAESSEYVASTIPTHGDFFRWVNEGIDRHPLLNFQPAAFSTNLIPISPGGGGAASDNAGSSREIWIRGKNTLFTYLPKDGDGVIRFSVTGGHLNRKRGPVKIRVFPVWHPLGESVANIEVPADKAAHAVEIKSAFDGLHRIEIEDGHDLTALHWPADAPLVLPSGQESSMEIHGRYSLYFYVPQGTTFIAGYADSRTGEIIAPDGGVAFRFPEMAGAGYFQVPVPAGHDRAVWMLRQSSGKRLLMTVPPYLSLSPETLLVPKETVQ